MRPNPFRFALSFGLGLGVLAASPPAAVAADDDVWLIPAGFTSSQEDIAPGTAFVGGLALAPNGDALVFDGEAVVRIAGATRTELHRPPAGTWGSFLTLEPDGTSVLFGESMEGTIRRISLEGGASEPLETIAGNFALAFDSTGRAFVSAPVDATTNGVWLADLDPATPALLVATVPHASGPLAFLPSGDLLVATAGWKIPSDLLVFPSDALEAAIAGEPIDAGAARILASDLPGAYGLAVDAAGRAFVSESASGSILSVEPDGAVSTFALPAEGVFAAPTYLTLRAGDGAFRAGAGPAAGELAFTSSDFATFNVLTRVVAELHFIRGEVNGDGRIDIADAVWTLGALYGGLPLRIADAADVNDDGILDLADPIRLLDHLFRSGEPPAAPYPTPGPDPTPDELP
ncbi:MAG: hypothetical protein JXP34_20185 [Planctomycetes bacterium]|nr:hypothetical protein [Planctomycetota bacterium]